MRKTASIIFVVIIFCFTSSKSFARQGCSVFDVLCQLTGKGVKDTKRSKKTEGINEKGKIIYKGRKVNPDGCVDFDFICKLTGRGKVKPKVIKKTNRPQIVLHKIKNKSPKKKEKIKNTKMNLFTGMFDFSDDKQRAVLVGLQHQNDELYRDSSIGKLSPISGGFLTENNAFYLYTGVQAEYEVGLFKITPSFTPGYYNYGSGKDLGFPLEFKSEVQMTLDLSESTHLGMSYNHISNASLGTKNPGANSYMFNFLKNF